MPEPTRYALFAGDFYYPVGGWSDLRGIFSEKEDAIATAEGWLAPRTHTTSDGTYSFVTSTEDWAQVVDLETHELIFSETRGNHEE